MISSIRLLVRDESYPKLDEETGLRSLVAEFITRIILKYLPVGHMWVVRELDDLLSFVKWVGALPSHGA